MTRATEEKDALVLAAIERAASAGEPCPKNDAIAGLVDAASTSQSAAIISRLERRGLISVERGACCRVVTILATGLRTAGKVSKSHWRISGRDPAREQTRIAEREARTARRSAPKGRCAEGTGPELPANFMPADRDPCPYCGTRRDLGCDHQRPGPTLSPELSKALELARAA